MKKTILLLITVISISTTFAQYGGNQQRGNHDVVINTGNRDHGYERGTYFFSARDKDMQIAQINANYDQKVRSVRNKFFMGRFQKDRMIDQLQAQRSDEIRGVWAKFKDNKNLFTQQGRRDDDKRHNW